MNHRFGFQNSLGSFIFWNHLTYGSIYLRTLTDSNFEMKILEMSGHVDTSIDLAFYIVGCGICHDSCFLSFSRLLIGLSLSLFSFFVTYNSFFWECLSRYVESSSYITYAQARDKTSFMVMHWYFISYLYRFRAMEHAEALSTGWIHFFSRIVLYSYTVIQLDVVASRKEIVGHLF